jgi:hypothetical protein
VKCVGVTPSPPCADRFECRLEIALRMRRTTIVLIVAAVFGIGLSGVCLWRLSGEHYGVGVDSVGWLPPEAHNITYVRNDAITIAEFDIEQEAYQRWCADRGMPLSKVRDGEVCSVNRPMASLVRRGVIRMTPQPNEDDENWHRLANKSFDAGDLFYEARRPDGGGYTLGYDVRERRGYYLYLDH